MHAAPLDPQLSYERDGAVAFRGAIALHMSALQRDLAHLAHNAAGARIAGLAVLQPYLSNEGPVGAIAARLLGNGCRPVRAILFDKTATTNWSLAWHQDRTICVRRRVDVDGFGPWTMKAELQHVVPPFDLLSRMITLRVHLDDVPSDNAPLLVAPGSHKFGRVPLERIGEVVRQCGVLQCLAEAGDVWLYATPILHASECARAPRHRRVLQVDFSADELPGGLEWLGV